MASAIVASSFAGVSLSRTTTCHKFSARRPVSRANIRCQAEEASTTSSSGAPETPKAAADTCPTCGVARSEMSFGCQGDGRIAGGIGAVPGMGWWPIKAYRPCPKATAAGIRYQRKGQVVDEVLFGKKQ